MSILKIIKSCKWLASFVITLTVEKSIQDKEELKMERKKAREEAEEQSRLERERIEKLVAGKKKANCRKRSLQISL